MSVNINSNITDYEKTAIKCVKESLLLDKGHGNINEFKTQLQNLMILNQLPQFQSDTNNELLHLIEQLFDSQSVKTSNNCTQSDPMLLFFYRKHCKASSDFAKEWKNIKGLIKSNIKMIAIHCDDPKYKNICERLNVYQYPTIKYINNNKILDYLGEMNSSEIIKTFNL